MELFYFAAEHGIKVVIETQSVEMILRGRLLVRKNPEYKDDRPVFLDRAS